MGASNIPAIDIRPALRDIADRIIDTARTAAGTLAREITLGAFSTAYPGMYSDAAKAKLREEDPFDALEVLFAISGTADKRAALNVPRTQGPNAPQSAVRLSAVPQSAQADPLAR